MRTVRSLSLEDTGVWVDFDYDDLTTYPKESEAYTVNDGLGGETLVLWDSNIRFWKTDGLFFVDKWLLEDCR